MECRRRVKHASEESREMKLVIGNYITYVKRIKCLNKKNKQRGTRWNNGCNEVKHDSGKITLEKRW